MEKESEARSWFAALWSADKSRSYPASEGAAGREEVERCPKIFGR